jgi:hypothetical protein
MAAVGRAGSRKPLSAHAGSRPSQLAMAIWTWRRPRGTPSSGRTYSTRLRRREEMGQRAREATARADKRAQQEHGVGHMTAGRLPTPGLAKRGTQSESAANSFSGHKAEDVVGM